VLPEGPEGALEVDLDREPEAVADLLTDLLGRLAAFPGAPPALLETTWGTEPTLRLFGIDPRLLGELLRPNPSPAIRWAYPAPPSGPGEPPIAEGGFLLVGAAAPSDPEERSSPAPRPPERAVEEELDPPAAAELPAGVAVRAQVHLAPSGRGALFAAARFRASGPVGSDPLGVAVGTVAGRLRATGVAFELAVRPFRRRFRREWARGAWRRLRPERRFLLDPVGVMRLALVGGLPPPPREATEERHTVLFGASGSGKSTYLLHLARERLQAHRALVVFDVHGDLSPRLVSDLSERARTSLIAIDPTRPGPVPAVAFLAAEGPAAEVERAHLLAALRRLGSDEGGVYWGFRLDRIFDSFVRLAQEEGGGFRDVYDLLTDPARRELARTRTSTPELLRFLEELPALLRRNPEFLWPAAARLHRVASSPELSRLVSPTGPPLPVEEHLAGGGALLWRVPVAAFGPEGVQFVLTLLATRVYLGLVSRALERGAVPAGVTILLDEAHLLAPRLLTEMLAEGRKFGVRLVLATQYPDRLAPEVVDAAAGSVGSHLVFRVPRAHAGAVARWVGLSPAEGERRLAALPAGVAYELRSGPGQRRHRRQVPPAPAPEEERWEEAVRLSQRAYGGELPSSGTLGPEEEALLLALLAGETERPTPDLPELARRLPELAGEERLPRLLRRCRANGEVTGPEERPVLTATGRYHLGYSPFTGASRESEVHRGLILRAFRIFARHGHRLEILRQDRFDARRPDARLKWVGPEVAALPPPLLAQRLELWKRSWGWRLFGGRDVHVEAEVSGAERPERIRYDLAKGGSRSAYVLFVVPDAARARRVRSVLRAEGVDRDRAAVWTLGGGVGPEPSNPPAG
jgi:hypothetical protein